ncbi:hypothetical protein DJ522_03400 [Sulfolobus sp. F3]|nr:hypothetical protein DJ522_03400 [Sulfolobus sp. F3]
MFMKRRYLALIAIILFLTFTILVYIKFSIINSNVKIHEIFLLYNNSDMSINYVYPYGYGYQIKQLYSNNVSIFISPYLWNYRMAEGFINLTYIKDYGLRLIVNLTSFKKINPNIDVDGYPGIMYGQEYWFPFQGKTAESQWLELPINVTTTPKIYSLLNYTIWDENGTIDDFSYDIWLSQNPNISNLQFPDIELMIWLYHESNITSPFFIKEGNVTVTIEVNGTKENDTFLVYVLPHTGSASGWIGVYYLSEKNLEGEVEIPLNFFLNNEFFFINKVFPQIYEKTFYLDAIQIGMEFNDNHGNAQMGFNLYSWDLTIIDE